MSARTQAPDSTQMTVLSDLVVFCFMSFSCFAGAEVAPAMVYLPVMVTVMVPIPPLPSQPSPETPEMA